ncbi:MAG TPA: glycosyltransferase family 2 protein [Terriglobia bacterium]|nr:glycosyltransferase family 2 protein [Terriglobia bacterium]
MAPRISAVINTFNEERNLPYALRSVKQWVEEIVVVDMHSQDRTVEIARQFGAKVCLHEGPGFDYAPREFAIAQASGEWTFVLDADELAPIGLSRELRSIAEQDKTDVVLIPRRNYASGAALKHGGFGPEEDYQARFFRPDKILASSVAHRDFLPAAGSRVLRLPYKPGQAIEHFAFPDYSSWFERMNRYTTIEARQSLARGKRTGAFRALSKSLRTFLRLYIRRRGYRDGWRGFYFSLGSAFYVLVVHAKLTELLLAGPRERTIASYQAEAERILGEYGEQ